MKLVIRGARHVDVATRTVSDGVSVAIDDGVIAQVATDADIVDDGAEIVHAAGRYLLPGLIDSHVHIRSGAHQGPSNEAPVPDDMLGTDPEGERAGILACLAGFLYCGVTSVYDAGNAEDVILRLRAAERSGEIASPRIFCSGAFVTATGGHGSNLGSATLIDSLPLDIGKLDQHLAREPDVLKVTYDEHNWGVRPLIPILTPDVLRGIIARAHAAKTRVTVHVSSETRAREAVDCGTDALAHPVIQSPATDEFLWLLAVKQIPVASTLAIGSRYFSLVDDPSFLDTPLYRHCLEPAEYQRLLTVEREHQRQNRWADWMRVMTPVAQDNLRRLAEIGGVIAAGSDLSFGPELHRELVLLQQAGLTPWEVLRSATVNGARYIGVAERVGAIRAGQRADLILVDEDPTTDVGHLASVSAVLKDGQVIDRASLRVTG